jgi:hypothetical protein
LGAVPQIDTLGRYSLGHKLNRLRWYNDYLVVAQRDSMHASPAPDQKATETSWPVVEGMHEPENSVCFRVTDRPSPPCALTPNIQTGLFVTSLAYDKPGSAVPSYPVEGG